MENLNLKVASALCAIANMGLNTPSYDRIESCNDSFVKFPNMNIREAVGTLANEYIESDNMFESFVEEAEGWYDTSELTMEIAQKIIKEKREKLQV